MYLYPPNLFNEPVGLISIILPASGAPFDANTSALLTLPENVTVGEL